MQVSTTFRQKNDSLLGVATNETPSCAVKPSSALSYLLALSLFKAVKNVGNDHAKKILRVKLADSTVVMMQEVCITRTLYCLSLLFIYIFLFCFW